VRIDIIYLAKQMRKKWKDAWKRANSVEIRHGQKLMSDREGK
jgi:hypothetical protein